MAAPTGVGRAVDSCLREAAACCRCHGPSGRMQRVKNKRLQTKKETKLQIPKPDAYDGSVISNPTYQRQYETINDYLYHNRGSWEGDSDLIRVVGAFMKEKARDWYDN